MARKNRNDFFWVSFSDLMTSLFFVMLVLFAVTVYLMQEQHKAAQAQHEATKEQLALIQEIQNAVTELPTEYFKYDPTYKRFSLIRDIKFDKQKAEFKSKADEDYLEEVGQSISDLIKTFKEKYEGQDIKFVVIVEGMASKDNYILNAKLSYERALEVKKLWEKKDIFFDESVAEIQIAGSGIDGVGRFPSDQEEKNQRILIQLIPKIGDLKVE